MRSTELTPTAVLGFTLENAREVTRRLCPHRPPIDVVVRPHFGCLPAQVRDISEHGVGLRCLKPLEPGTRLLFRIEPDCRFIRARVTHSTRVRDGWHVGCFFTEPLTADEVTAYVASDVAPEDEFA